MGALPIRCQLNGFWTGLRRDWALFTIPNAQSFLFCGFGQSGIAGGQIRALRTQERQVADPMSTWTRKPPASPRSWSSFTRQARSKTSKTLPLREPDPSLWRQLYCPHGTGCGQSGSSQRMDGASTRRETLRACRGAARPNSISRLTLRFASRQMALRMNAQKRLSLAN